MTNNIKVDLYLATTKLDKQTKKDLVEKNKNFKEKLLENNILNRKIFLLQDFNLLKRNQDILSQQNKKKDDCLIKLSNILISKGNFYYPLNHNYKNEVKSGELKYIVKHTKKNILDDTLICENNYTNALNWTFDEIFLPDDIKTNCLIIHMFNSYMKDKIIFNHDEFFEFFRAFFTKIQRKDCLERMKKLFFRFKNNIGDFTNLYIFLKCSQYLSCKQGTELNFSSISETYKDFFCGICLKFNCALHGINYKSNYDNNDCYNLEHFVASFKILLNNSFAVILEEEDIKMLNSPTTFQSNNNFIQYLLKTRKEFFEFLKSKDILIGDNQFRSSQIDKILDLNSKRKYLSEKNACSLSCYLKFLACNDIDKMYQKLDFKFTELEEIMFSKLFRIFKFDPCAIYQSLKFFEKPRSNNHNKNLRKPKVRINNNHLSFMKNYLISTNLADNEILFEEDNLNCAKIYLYLMKMKYENVLDECILYYLFKSKILDKQKPTKRLYINTSSLQKIKKNGIESQAISYKPCFHKGNEPCSKFNCDCFDRGFCEKYCACNKELCKLRFKGCLCEKGNCMTSTCLCFGSGRECDTDLCRNCRHYDVNVEKMNLICKNKLLQSKILKKTVVSESNIAGWGLFALEKISKGEFIAEYVGEIITQEEADRREIINEMEKSTYMFNLNNESIIDARMMGNKIRFANHSKQYQNATTRIYFVNGEHRVGLYAICDILPKQEILFDYDGLNILANKFSWVDDKKKTNLVGNKRLRKDMKVEKNIIEMHNENEILSLEEFKSNLDKNINVKQKYNDVDQNNCHEIEIDIFNIKNKN